MTVNGMTSPPAPLWVHSRPLSASIESEGALAVHVWASIRGDAFAQDARGEIDADHAGDVHGIDLAFAAVDHHHQLIATGRNALERVGLAAPDHARLLLAQMVGTPRARARGNEIEL